jgi:hypothetical protein
MVIADEPRGPTPFTGTAKPYRSRSGQHEERRADHTESSPAAEHVGRGDSVAAARAAELVSHRPVPSAAHTVPTALPAHVAFSHPALPTGIAKVAEFRQLCGQATNADGKPNI